MSRFAVQVLVANLATSLVVAGDLMSYVFFENQEFISNASNVAKISWKEVEAAFEHPNHVDVSSYSGLDWTQPFPGSPINGFQAHLRIVNDVPWPEDVARNQSTELTALTFSFPESLMDSAKSLPKPMHPSWSICQHYFVSAQPDPTKTIDHTCGFLPKGCRDDLQTSLTGSWFQKDPDVPCSSFALEPIPPSCIGTLGRIRGDVINWGSDAFEDDFTSRYLAVDQVNQASWMLGTGTVDTGNTTAYYEASNRTFIVGTVFGYSGKADEANKETPKLSLACLRPEWVPQPKPSGTTTTSIITPAVYSTETTTEIPAVTIPDDAPTSTSTTETVCVSGTASPNRSGGNFKELCQFTCTYGFCPPTACQCLEYSTVPKVAPTTNGRDGCVLDGVKDSDYEHLCMFACSHGTCPETACRIC